MVAYTFLEWSQTLEFPSLLLSFLYTALVSVSVNAWRLKADGGSLHPQLYSYFNKAHKNRQRWRHECGNIQRRGGGEELIE
jgi:hypothetical protein